MEDNLMIYDCFIFNTELELLELRLNFLSPYVDKFVIIESEQTLSGQKKPLHFKNNIDRFQKFSDKIIHVICPNKAFESAWEYEYFQRDYIRRALVKCNDTDIIIISDVDEIINLPDIKERHGLREACLVELYVNYYFLNLTSEHKFAVNLIAQYEIIKDKNIGNRDNYHAFTSIILKQTKDFNPGWHLSYLFGTNYPDYINKIKSFSHQEYNNSFYLDVARIKICITFGLDLFERKTIQFKAVKQSKIFTKEFYARIKQLNMENKYLYFRPRLIEYLKPIHANYIFRLKYYPRLKSFIKNFINW